MINEKPCRIETQKVKVYTIIENYEELNVMIIHCIFYTNCHFGNTF